MRGGGEFFLSVVCAGSFVCVGLVNPHLNKPLTVTDKIIRRLYEKDCSCGSCRIKYGSGCQCARFKQGFFDAQYALAQIGFNHTVGNTKSEVKASFGGTSTTNSSDMKLEVGYFNIGIFGKYPFAVGSAKISPMLGFEFDIATSAKYGGYDFPLKEKLNAYWIDAGAGADIFVMKNLFIRPQLLLGFQMNKNDFITFQTNGIKIDAGIGAGWKF